MTHERPFTPTLQDHLALETEDAKAQVAALRAQQRAEHQQRELNTQLEDSGIRRVVALLDGEMMRRAVTLTPDKIAAMNAIERRQLLDWITGRVSLLDEKASLLERNSGSEPETPECWRMAHAATAA